MATPCTAPVWPLGGFASSSRCSNCLATRPRDLRAVYEKRRSARPSIAAVGALYAPERLHDVRLAVKKLRYTSELVAEVTPRRLDTDIATLKGAQDLLGRLHDLEMLIGRAREVQASFPLSDLVKWRSLDSVVSFLEQGGRQLPALSMRAPTGPIAVKGRLVSGGSESEPVAERAVS